MSKLQITDAIQKEALSALAIYKDVRQPKERSRKKNEKKNSPSNEAPVQHIGGVTPGQSRNFGPVAPTGARDALGPV